MSGPIETKQPPYDDGPERGLECRQCGCHHFTVVWIRHHTRQKRRKLACRYCGKTCITIERMVDAE